MARGEGNGDKQAPAKPAPCPIARELMRQFPALTAAEAQRLADARKGAR